MLPDSEGGRTAPARLGVVFRLRDWRTSLPFLPVPFWLCAGGMVEMCGGSRLEMV